MCASALLCVHYRAVQTTRISEVDNLGEQALDVLGVVPAGEQESALVQEPVAFIERSLGAALATALVEVSLSCHAS